ncbi:hypothetical protein FZ025_09525 [Xanthomonas hyacinthi]|uniref:Aconitase/3-isopropylmalate dehydratase large subunit alpha/beta/alpha domain-containing protein n=1 Tax=Xanthomonas hyacinthi TaxID=56455 RepID=A0A2S7EY56_9XANT|nr:aconitase family protein [Xanthomonas hyacinthi]KLD77779.1 hypothetical protein Y886_13880 [Xanthomonas hyacinthi DSM 19077]PPU98086.1 hypothetical protein XhyaCFBP1156_07625 [Xanthomonas hyacinthi]QGY76876.1 hypothetical protein FZ025_09525 [Xanthomonas hyacinthi]
MNAIPHTLYDRLRDAHAIEERDDGTCLICVDRHLVHELTSPQALESLRLTSRTVRRPTMTLAMADHNVPIWCLADIGIRAIFASSFADIFWQNAR